MSTALPVYFSLRRRLHSTNTTVHNLCQFPAGQWEASEVKTILEALQRSTGGASHVYAEEVVPQENRAVLLDIGANIGIFSFVAAVLGYTVYSFEAMPRNVAALHQTLCWNPGLRDTLTVSPPV